MININTNHGSLMAALYQRSVTSEMQRSFERLSSGMRINRSADDAAGMSFATKLLSQLNGMQTAVENSLDGISLIQSASSAIDEINNILLRLDELAKQMANGVYSRTDRLNVQNEVTSLLSEIQRITNHTSFNGIALLDGTLDTVIRAGNKNNEIVKIAIPGMSILSFIEGISESSGTSKSILRPSLTTSVSTAFDIKTNSQAILNKNTINVAAQRSAAGTSTQTTPETTQATGLSTKSILSNSTAVNGISTFSTLSNSYATGSSTSVYDAGDQPASVVSHSVPDGAADGSSILTSVEFSNGNFATVTATQNGNIVSIPGWDIHLEQVSLGPNTNPSITSTIGGFSTPTDSINPSRAIGDDIVANTSYSYRIVNGEIGLTVGNLSLASFVQIHGPYIISKGSVELEQGDQVSFDYFAQAGGDDYDAFGYLLDVNTGNIVELLNKTGSSTQSLSTSPALRNETVTTTVNQAGNYKFVFVAGTFDATGGRYLGGSLWISNVGITQANPPAANETTGRVYVEAKEAAIGSNITVDSNLFSSLQTAAATDPNQPKNPDGTVNPSGGRFSLEWSGSGPSPFTVDQYTGDVTASGLLYDTVNPASNNYTFKVKYTGSAASGGLTHEETVNLEVTETLKATSTLEVQEATSSAVIEITALDKLHAFASADSFQGAFSFANSNSTLAQNYNIDPSTGKITSKTGIEFDGLSPNPVSGVINYTAKDNRVFENTINLTVTDTLSSNATVYAEQADVVKIDIQSQLTSIYAFAQNKDPGFNLNKFSIGTRNGANSQFSVVAGEVVSNATPSRPKMLISDQQSYEFDLIYQKDGNTSFTEAITLNLTESLQSLSSFSAFEASTNISIPEGLSSQIYEFAQKDNFSGIFEFVNPSSGDAKLFNISSATGEITSKSGVEFENFATGSEKYNFSVTYTASDGRIFTDNVQIDIQDTLAATASIESEQANQVIISIQNQLSNSYSFATRNSGFSWNNFSISSRNNGNRLFEIVNNLDVDGDGSIDSGYIKSTEALLKENQQNHEFDLIYTLSDGTQHVETVMLEISQSLQATSELYAVEGNQVSFGGSDLGEIYNFAYDDNFSGSFRFKTPSEVAADPTSTNDHSAFQINGTQVSSIGALDFDTKNRYEVDLIYTNSSGKTFTQRVNLNLSDTISATTSLTVEEAAEVITNLSSLSSYAYATKEFAKANPGKAYLPNYDEFYLTSSTGDHSKLKISADGNILSLDEFRKSTQELYNFNVVHSSGNKTFTEKINLVVTDTTYNKSDSVVTVSESASVQIKLNTLTNINNYASSDNYAGSFELAATSSNYDGHTLFAIDSEGNLASHQPIDYETDKQINRFKLIYKGGGYENDNTKIYEENITLKILNNKRDDNNLSAVENIDLTTASGANEASKNVTLALEKVTSVQSNLGSIQNRLQHSINNLTMGALMSEISLGRVIDADFAKETSELAKAQILSKSASAMLAQANQANELVLRLLI